MGQVRTASATLAAFRPPPTLSAAPSRLLGEVRSPQLGQPHPSAGFSHCTLSAGVSQCSLEGQGANIFGFVGHMRSELCCSQEGSLRQHVRE